ncbi:MAG: S46 family peptidase [Candidatus Cryptobacteroides sp.]
MKRILCFLTAVAVFAGSLRADEGMWMLPLLKELNADAMKNLGCRLTPEQIYSINNSSLKDAIVQFGGGCTGEIISDEGLLVTNHHCGYGSIQKLSSIEHNYLADGYWAMSRQEELPCNGLTVTFLENMVDVTAIREKAEKKARKKFASDADIEDKVSKAVDEAVEEIKKQLDKDYPFCDVTLTPYYNRNVYYLLVTKTYRDVRFVGAPPSSIGKFGADTDNWMWPRHTGDFSMFRVYADKDNNPADYSEENVPLSPKNHLQISLKGVQEGEYTMIMGFPGSTTRFQTSPELEFQIETNDIRIAARTVRQNVMLEHMLADPKVKIQYASKYSGSSNGWKKWQGMKLAFGKLGIIERAKQEEKAFSEWVDDKSKRQEEFGNALKDIENGVESYRKEMLAYTLGTETIGRIELVGFAAILKNEFNKNLKSGKDTLTALTAAFESMSPSYADYSPVVDRDEAKALMKFYRDNASTEDFMDGLGEDFATMDIDAYVDRTFDATAFTSAEALSEAIACKGTGIFDDPAAVLSKSVFNLAYKYRGAIIKSFSTLGDARQTYTKGLLQWKKGQAMYPDANFTMRLTYGTVKGYSPKDGVLYRYYTTLDGVMEKEDPDNWEFVVPAKLKQLWKDEDFGDYAREDGKMPVAFLSNNDITGGNSGSPIMNADGQLIGLAFDGNWESMSSDVMFEPDLQRCINVDIRYVLFIVDKFGGARHLIDEMDIVK